MQLIYQYLHLCSSLYAGITTLKCTLHFSYKDGKAAVLFVFGLKKYFSFSSRHISGYGFVIINNITEN